MKTFPLALLLAVTCLFAIAFQFPSQPNHDSMNDPIKAAEQATADYVQRFGTDIVIADRNGTEIELKATLLETVDRQAQGSSRNGPETIARTTDFLCVTSDLGDLAGKIDRSVRVQHDDRAYQPVPIGSEPLARESRHRLLTRIHTVEV